MHPTLIRLFSFLFLVIGSGLGCDSENSPEDEAGLNSGPVGKYDGGWVDTGDGSYVPDVAGSYHLVLDSLIQTKDLDTGKEETNISEAHVLAHVTQQGAQIFLELDFCDLILAEGRRKKTVFQERDHPCPGVRTVEWTGRVEWIGMDRCGGSGGMGGRSHPGQPVDG